SSVARVVLTPGKGVFTINGRTFEDYLPSAATRLDVLQPLTLTSNEGKCDVSANVNGGGLIEQAGAIRLGIPSALIEADADLRKVLDPAGLVTRVPRAKGRKKYGHKKARRASQFSKR